MPVTIDGASPTMAAMMMATNTAANCKPYGFRYERMRTSKPFVSLDMFAFSSSVKY